MKAYNKTWEFPKKLLGRHKMTGLMTAIFFMLVGGILSVSCYLAIMKGQEMPGGTIGEQQQNLQAKHPFYAMLNRAWLFYIGMITMTLGLLSMLAIIML